MKNFFIVSFLIFLSQCSSPFSLENESSKKLSKKKGFATSTGYKIKLFVYSNDKLEGKLESVEVKEFRKQQRIDLYRVRTRVQRKEDKWPIYILAQKGQYFSDSNLVSLQGKVSIQYGKLSLFAPEILWDVDSKVLTAAGEVEFKMNKSRINGNFFQFNTDSRRWKLRKVKGILDLSTLSNSSIGF